MQRIAPYLVGLLVLSAAGCTTKKGDSSSSSSAASTSAGSTSSSTSTGTSASSTGSHSSSSSTGGTSSATSSSSSASSSSASSGTSGTGSTGSSSSSGSSSSGSTGLTHAQFCAQAEPLLCTLAATCQATDPATTNCNVLIANVASNLLGCSGQTAVDEQQGLIQFDPTATSACLAALNGSPGCSTQGQAALVAACSTSRLFKAATPLGSACVANEDCIPDVLTDGGVAGSTCYADQSTEYCSQTCRSNARALGEDCDPYDSRVFCLAGGCNPDPSGGPVEFVGTTGYVCTLYVTTGGACDYDNVCDPSADYCQTTFDADAGSQVSVCAPRSATAACDGQSCYATPSAACSCPLGTVCSSGSCQQPAALGAPCDPQALAVPCQAGLICGYGSTGTGTCVRQTALLGQACNPSFGSNCEDGTYCSAAQVCIAEATVGQGCDESAGNCPSGLLCLATDGGADAGAPTCQPLGRIGDDCSNGYCRTLLTCGNAADGGAVCQPRLVQGDACDPTTDSCYGSFCDLTTRHCATYLPSGSPCNPQEYSACGSQYCVQVADGGSICSTECFFPELAR